MSLSSKFFKCSIVFTNSVLGSQPGKDTTSSDFLTQKAIKERPDLADSIKENTDSLPEIIEKATTGFYRLENGEPCFKSYQIKGAIKEAGDVLNGVGGFKAMRSKLDNLVFVSPCDIPIKTDSPVVMLERPLKGMTMQGPRVSLARSEEIAAGASCEFEIEILDSPKCSLTEDILRTLLDYATKKGIGQWRNSGIHGQFTYVLEAK